SRASRLAARPARVLPLPARRRRPERGSGDVQRAPGDRAAFLPSPPDPRRRNARRRPSRVMLSVVAPAYDEADVLPLFVTRLVDVLEGCGYDWEVVLVDDGSRDGTWDVIEAASQREPRIRGIRL